MLAKALYWTGGLEGAGKISGMIANLLDWAPPRKDHVPDSPPDSDLLSLALAGKGATAIRRDDFRAGEALFKRSLTLSSNSGGRSAVAVMGNWYRANFLPPPHRTARLAAAGRGLTPLAGAKSRQRSARRTGDCGGRGTSKQPEDGRSARRRRMD
jgi:hypothetical protein